MDYEDLRPLVLEAARQMRNVKRLELRQLIDQTDKVAREAGFYTDHQPWFNDRRYPEHYMPLEDREKVRQIIWELILQGLIAIGMDVVNPNFPWISITDYGRHVLSQTQITPYDPDGYLSELQSNIPNLDSMITMYVAESLRGLRHGLIFSSAVMLGVASERAFNLLLETLTNAVTHQRTKKRLLRLQTRYQTARKFNTVKLEILKIRNQLPHELSYNIETHLDSIFTIIRITQNDAGHPTGRKIDRSQAFVHLQLFPHYCKTVYD